MDFPKSSKSKVMEKMAAKKKDDEPGKFEISPMAKANNRISFRIDLEKKIVNGRKIVSAKFESNDSYYLGVHSVGEKPKQQPPAEEYHDMAKFGEVVAARLAEAAKQLG